MTSLKGRLIALNNEALSFEQDVKGIKEDHPDMISKMNTIESFIKDNKEAIEKEATENVQVETAYNDLKDTLTRLKTELTALKTAHTELKGKIASVATLCVFSGTVVGLIGGLSLSSIKGLIDK